MRIIKAIKAKIAYERESYRMSCVELEELRKERPEMFRPKRGGR